ncbi:hypothetical protein CKG00_16790 (plasmid) [Morganella morganii]|uniref:Uncharacterized protein n=1 Tax=Morganella morganii TaxID=582 RepID=A0A433ZRQ4_MORMO|nr:hypothetical protein [Morganella morganii]RUT64800.1 hypothetical protein CKG00_16790 [Morganella morganii]
MNLNTVWRFMQYRRVQRGVISGIWLSAGVVFWCFYLQPAAGETAIQFRQLQRLTALSEQAVPEVSSLPAPDIPPLFTLLPENALPVLTGWQQEPPEQPERWVLTFEAHYPELAALLDTLSGELTRLPITQLSLHPLTPGTPSFPPLLQMTLHLALLGFDLQNSEKEWHDD